MTERMNFVRILIGSGLAVLPSIALSQVFTCDMEKDQSLRIEVEVENDDQRDMRFSVSDAGGNLTWEKNFVFVKDEFEFMMGLPVELRKQRTGRKDTGLDFVYDLVEKKGQLSVVETFVSYSVYGGRRRDYLEVRTPVDSSLENCELEVLQTLSSADSLL